nr:reverse transcriptase domain-containing protein [Tanacetum cinerariifolium]
MQTRSSSRLVSNPSLNPTPFTNPNPKGHNHRRSKQRIEDFNLEELSPPIVTMVDQCTMAQLLQAPTEGYENAIVVPAITADNFELKHGLLTLFQNKQFFGHDKEDPHAHVRYFNNITSTLKFPNVPNTSIKLMLFPFSLEGAARIWLEKESLRSIFTWDDLVSKFINQFFPPSKTTNLRNEIINFQQRFHESFSEAWDRFKDLLRAYPHHGFSDLHQLDTFYNQGNASYHPPMMSNQIRPPGFPLVPNNQNVQRNTYQAPAYQARAPQTQGVSKEDFSAYVKANDVVMRNILRACNCSVSASKPNPKTSIPYPSRRNDERNREKANNQNEKFYQIFKDTSFKIIFAVALILMPKFVSTLKALIRNKEKLSEMARTSLNEHCSVVLFKKLPEKLGDPGKFLIPCDFPGMAECLALADLGASINLMPFFVWKRLSLPDLTPTCMTLELADRSISRSVRVAEDVYVKVGSFYFLANFVVVDFDADPRVPLIFRRSFLKTERSLIDVFEGELTLRVGKKAITFNLDQTSRYSANYSDMTAKQINVIDMACEEYSQEVLGFSDTILSGNPTPYYDPIVSITSLTLSPFRNSDFLLEEVDAFLAIEDDPTSFEFYQPYLDPEGDILLLKAFLNDDPSLPPLNQGNYLPEVRKELKIRETKSDKYSVDEPPARCMMAIFHDMIEKTMEVFMDDFSVFWNSFQSCLSHLERMLKRCEGTNLCPNWEKSHFMVKEGIVLSYKISKQGIKVDKAKEFTFKVVDIKGAENLAADHLSRLENPHQNVIDPKEINKSFPLETLNLVSTRGKLKSRWSGPFTISQGYPYSTVELSQPGEPNFKVNGHRLKHYFGEDVPKLVVSDLQTFSKDH